MSAIRKLAGRLGSTWGNIRLARAALGKHIIFCASTLHFAWAGLLVFAPAVSGATAVNVIVQLCGGRYRAAAVLALAALAAVVFPFKKRPVSAATTALMLIPQQTLLLMSAGAGIYATWVQHYGDGEYRPWSFILGDQLVYVVLALLYTIVVIEAAGYSEERIVKEES